MAGSDDLAPLFAAEPGQVVHKGQGQILQWDPDTFENKILFRGTEVPNMRVKSAVDALTFQVGDVVTLEGYASDDGGFSSWWIDGRIIIPGAGNAEQVVAFLQSNLGRSIALEVIAETFASDSVVSLEGTSSTTPADLATPGPSVNVEIGDSGRMVVTVSANIRPPTATLSATQAITTTAHMGFEITGATGLSASNSGQLTITHRDDFGAGGEGSSDGMTASRQVLVTGLNPGTHTVTAKYWRSGAVTDAGDADFVGRVIAVQAF